MNKYSWMNENGSVVGKAQQKDNTMEMVQLNTLEQSLVKIGEQKELREFLEGWTLTGESLEERLENPVISTGNLQLKLRLTSPIGTLVMDLDGTSKTVFLGKRQSDTAGKTEDIFSLEILHVPKDNIRTTERTSLSSILLNSVYWGSYVIKQTVLYKCGLTERAVSGKVPLAILRTSGADGYLCLELNSPE